MQTGSNFHCIVCGTGMTPGLTTWHRSCSGCGYESADLKPAINEQATHGLIDEDAREKSLKAIRQENFKLIVDWADKYVGGGGRKLLDVGSAHGWFLEEASKKFAAVGIEPDDTVRQVSIKKGASVRGGYFPDALESGERFDIIVFNDVIEHIPDINQALSAVHERLNSNGTLILNLPNSQGFFYKLSKLFAKVGVASPFERLWQKGLPSPHVHYFSENNLDILAGKHGFERAAMFQLPSLRANGLLERLRYVKNVSSIVSYAQYLILLIVIPMLSLFQSDIVVCAYKRKT